GGAAMEFPPSAIAVFIHRVFSPAKDDARATRGEAGPIHLTYKNSLQLSNAQQTLLTPCSRATATARRLSASVGRRPSVSPYARPPWPATSSPASCWTRSARWPACRSTKALCINPSACSGVVVTVRRGVFVEGSGQSSDSSSGLFAELTFIR